MVNIFLNSLEKLKEEHMKALKKLPQVKEMSKQLDLYLVILI